MPSARAQNTELEITLNDIPREVAARVQLIRLTQLRPLDGMDRRRQFLDLDSPSFAVVSSLERRNGAGVT